MMKKLVLLFLLPVCLLLTGTTNRFADDGVLRTKLFSLVESLQLDPRMQKALHNDKILKQAGRQYQNRVLAASRSCSGARCYADALQWSPKEIQTIGDRLIALSKNAKATANWLKKLRSTGSYARYDSLSDTAFIRNAWNELAAGTNRIFSVYVAGGKPRYETIDSISFNKNDPEFISNIKKLVLRIAETQREDIVLIDFPISVALDVLRLNRRDEAARYEPLNSGENAAAVAKIAVTKWNEYPYSLLLVPGYGPEAPGIPLDSRAARRCQLAAERYKKGMAPFIIVSGGHAYPIHTEFCEAMEMKKYLIRQFNIPADVIIIEPHARHTTTNLRNAARLIYRFGIPDDRPALVVTDRSQTDMIVKLAARCIRELGYVPYQKLQNLNEFETVFYPVKTVAHLNIDDPLDP